MTRQDFRKISGVRHCSGRGSSVTLGEETFDMTIMGIGWYKKEQWDQLRRVSEDRDQLEATWEEWAANAERTMVRLMKAGANVQKVAVDVDELLLWCRSQNRPCDGDARATFVTTHIR